MVAAFLLSPASVAVLGRDFASISPLELAPGGTQNSRPTEFGEALVKVAHGLLLLKIFLSYTDYRSGNLFCL